MPYIPVRELPDPPPPPKKKKPKLTANSFSTNGYVLVEEAPFDPRQVRFMRKKDLQRPPDTEDLPDDPKKGGWLLPLGGGLFIGLLLLMFTVGVLLPWWNGLQTQWHFGDAHISHYDQSGHHLVSEVFWGFVTVIDIPEGHPEHSQVFMLQGAPDNAVVQFETRDVNNDGIPDVTVGTESSPIGVTLYGTKDGGFSKTPPEGNK